MNTDNSQTGQQGYGRDQETDQQNQQPQGQQAQQGQSATQNAQPIGGNDSNTGGGTALSSGSSTSDFETGQASYGNSGQAEVSTQSQNSTDLGQEADMGQAGSQGQGEGMPLGSAGGGYGGSGETQSGDQSGSGFVGSSSDTSGDYLQSGSDDQDFADQGQGALQDDTMGRGEDPGTTDIEIERSQGRESDIEGSAL